MSIPVAIVDDKRLLRQSLSEQIAYYKEISVVLQSADGSAFLEGMKVFKADERPQVVLMDIEMPVMDGIEAVLIAKEIYPDVHFLMLTVFDDDEKLFEAIKAGASGYLLKDERVSNIVKAITEIVYEGGVPMSPRIARKALAMLRFHAVLLQYISRYTQPFVGSVTCVANILSAHFTAPKPEAVKSRMRLKKATPCCHFGFGFVWISYLV
jgi:DNA-binding NarL/FixJ family response regulator